MGLRRKLRHWQEEGLISPDQADRIARFETSRKSGRFVTGLLGAALFSILCGVLSVIAANWHSIPDAAKIGAHLLVNIGVAVALGRAAQPAWRESLALVLFGLTLTLIVLIGQVFQLGGNAANALLLWMVITTPLMMVFGESRITVIPWMIAFLTTLCLLMNEYLGGLPRIYGMMYVAAFLFALPLALIADGRLRFVRRHRPVWAEAALRTGFALIVAFASLAPLAWFRWFSDPFVFVAGKSGQAYALIDSAVMLAGASIAALLVVLYAARERWFRDAPGDRGGAWLLILCIASIALPYIFDVSRAFESVVSAIHMIALWLGIGWVAQANGWQRLVTLSVFVIAMRILFVYLEVFRDLMTTGFGLILTGIAILLILWAARHLNRFLKAHMA